MLDQEIPLLCFHLLAANEIYFLFNKLVSIFNEVIRFKNLDDHGSSGVLEIKQDNHEILFGFSDLGKYG